MKKLLLGSSALIASSALALSPAAAAGHYAVDEFLSISGDAVAGFFFVDDDTSISITENSPGSPGTTLTSPAVSGTENTSVKFLGEIYFEAEIELDNGLVTGARIELEGQSQGDQIDEHFVFIRGAFGRIVLGADDGAGNAMHYGVPSAVAGNGIDSPNFLNVSLDGMNIAENEGNADLLGTRTGTNIGLSGDANKISYYSPRFSGVQVGASYSPGFGNTGGGSSTGGVNVPITNQLDFTDLVSLGINYKANLGDDFSIKASAGYETANAVGSGVSNPDLWNIGGSVDFAGFTVGAAYQDRSDATGNQVDDDAWGVGVTYTLGPWSVGAGYLTADRQGTYAEQLDSSGAVARGETVVNNDFDHVQVGGSYNLVEGFDVGLSFDWYDVKNVARSVTDASTGESVTSEVSDDSWSLGLLLKASF